MWQSVQLDAGTYEMSFWYSPREADQTNGISYEVSWTDPNQAVCVGMTCYSGTVSVGDTVSGPGNGTSVGTWTQFKQQFTLDVGTTIEVRFSATGDDDTYGGLLDSVSIAPVPLPAAGFMLLAGVAGLGAMRARRKDK